MAERPKYQFKSVQLLKDQSLGIGAYGAVYKAKCDDLLCAAKVIHPTLFDPTALQQSTPQREHRLPVRRFEQECEFMSAIRHPNIVQYLGMFRDTDTRLPVLLMELMDDSLTHFLESSTQPIPYHIQVNICHDISLALSFPHSNKIIHRDLSSNNVLLISNIRTKVTDFGMARLGDINLQATCLTNTMCPGTDVYMPPEAIQDKPVYTEKIDCFSFGVIIIQILTRQFPNPGDRLKEVEFSHPGLPPGKVLVQAPEINRRQNHISQVPPSHTLLPIALDCLKDKDSKRPSAHHLCERVADLKGMPKYIDSLRENDEVIQSQAICMEEKDCMIASKEKENQQLRQQLKEKDRVSVQLEERERQFNQQLRQLQQERDQTSRENRTQLQEKERQLGHVNQQLEASEQVVAQFERRIDELEQQLSQREQQKTKVTSREKGPTGFKLIWREDNRRIAEPEQQHIASQRGHQKTKASSRGKELTSFKLRWREGKRALCRMHRYCDAVIEGNTVYIRNEGLVNIYTYDVTSDSWSQLPNDVHRYSSIAVINGWLTTVGGYSSPSYSNELLSLTGEGSGRRWTKKFPPMPTRRCSATALCTGTTLIVAGGEGGEGEGDRVLSTVEVMNTENHQWSTTSKSDLPEPMCYASATVCGDQLYMLGGVNKIHLDIKSVYTCSVSALLQSCVLSSLEAPVLEKTSLDKFSVWSQIADLPVMCSTCESLHSRLLAIGGMVDSGGATTAVYMYNSSTNSWEIINHMTTGRGDCFTAVLPDNRLMVVGGNTHRIKNTLFDVTNTVEFANVCNNNVIRLP